MKKKQRTSKVDTKWNGYLLAGSIIIAALTLIIGCFWYLIEKPKAVIIDQLGQTNPNVVLIKSISKNFSQAGVQVDYIPPEQVTVDFYRLLPKNQYKYIILRAHTCLFREDPTSDELAISTNEPYTPSKYRNEQIHGRLAWLNIPGDNVKYFGVSSRFVESSMVGSFNDATLIMMGCNGLTFSRMAEAFAKKGVNSIIGWDELVSLNHTDNATQLLVNDILKEQIGLKQTVEQVMTKIGRDPSYGSRLLVYPP